MRSYDGRTNRLDGARRSWALAALLVGCLVMACGSHGEGIFGESSGPGGAGGSPSTGGGGAGGQPRPPAKTDRIDLLLTVDNSRSMADKQEIMSLAIPSLLDSFINPACVDADGRPVGEQPASPDAPCPEGERQFPAVTDIHVGVITTSVGGHGSDSCTGDGEPTENDEGHLISRGPQNATVNTYESLGFLAWDPEQKKDPPGELQQSNLQTNLKALVLGAGQLGCGYEASLEAWYRFLVDPNPYQTITIEDGLAELDGTDQTLLAQRRNFLRPDSLLVVAVLSDENDCSIRDGGQYYFAAQRFQPGTTTQFRLPKPTAECADDPNDPCCRSCGQDQGDCPTSDDDCGGGLSSLEDHLNLRCFQQKRRFGIDFLYPIGRYAKGLTEPEVADREGQLKPNPLFSDLNPNDAHSEVRDERLVYFASIVGVPWQDIARKNQNGVPDLTDGLDDEGIARGAFQSGPEMERNGTWDLVIGKPPAYFSEEGAFPADPLMRESVDPRSGTHPITGEPVAPPGSAPLANRINGHEYSIPQRNDLQYACIFPLIQPRDCTHPNNAAACDCDDPNNDKPLCQTTDGDFGQVQYKAKAYPGIRQLQVARRLNDRAVVGSICPAQLENVNAPDFGYEPFVRSLVDATAPRLD